MATIQKNWIHFKTHFCTAHRELKETGELTTEDAGFHQYNLVNNIVAHISGQLFTYPGTKFGSNHRVNRTTYPSRQFRHRCRIQYPNPTTDQHAIDAATADKNADKPNRRFMTNQQPQRPTYSHSPGSN